MHAVAIFAVALASHQLLGDGQHGLSATAAPASTTEIFHFLVDFSFAVFIGSLQYSTPDAEMGLHRHYFKIISPIKHAGIYMSSSHAAHHNYACPVSLDTTDTTDAANITAVYTALSRPSLPILPTVGVVKAHSKHPLDDSNTHILVAASYHLLHGRQLLMMCCVDENERYAANFLRHMIFKKECKC